MFLHLKYMFTVVLWVRHRVVWHVVSTSDRGWFPLSSRLCGSLPTWRRKNQVGLKTHGHHFSLKESEVSQWTWLIFVTLSILVPWRRLSLYKLSTTLICLFLSPVYLRMETYPLFDIVQNTVMFIEWKNTTFRLKYHTKYPCLEFVCMTQYSHVNFHSTFWYVICISGMPRNFVWGGISTNSIEDREDRDLEAVVP